MGRGPSYSGKFIARAVELHFQGVQTGYLRVDDVQNKLAKEFAAELEMKDIAIPSPETIMTWVRKYPDASQRLRDLEAQQIDPSPKTSGTQTKLEYYQKPPSLPVTRPSNIIDDAMACMNYAIAGTFGMMMMGLLRS